MIVNILASIVNIELKKGHPSIGGKITTNQCYGFTFSNKFEEILSFILQISLDKKKIAEFF
jgi:hypothetical protein